MSSPHTNYGSSNDKNDSLESHSQESTTESNRENSPTPELTESENRFHWRVWIAVVICSVCYVVSFISLAPVSIQFFSSRIANEKYHFNFNHSSNFKCANISSDLGHLIDRVQKEASQVMLESGLATGIPACITCLLVGSYSDFIGRKPIMTVSIFGGFIRLFLLTCIIKFEWNIRVYYIGAFIDGLCGTYFTFILAATAIIADITPDSKNRALNFAVIEGLLLPTAAAAQIGIGYLIKEQSFLLPVGILCGILMISMFVNIFVLSETVTWKRVFTWNPKVHIKKAVGFYFLNESRQKRHLYQLGLGAFVVIALTNIGRQNVETLFELSDPLCWDSVEIGIYTAIKIVATAMFTVAFLRLMRNRLSLEYTGVVCAISGIGSFILFGLSRGSAGLYLAAIVGILYLGCIPIPRAMLSQLTSPTEQGALFSGLSVVETVSSLVSSTIFTLIYNMTIDSFKGTVFMVIAGFTLVNILFLVLFRMTRANSCLSDFTLLVEPGTNGKTSPHKNGVVPIISQDVSIGEESNLIAK